MVECERHGFGIGIGFGIGSLKLKALDGVRG